MNHCQECGIECTGNYCRECLEADARAAEYPPSFSDWDIYALQAAEQLEAERQPLE